MRITLEGVVQGVGLRPWLYRTATRLGLRGHVENTAGGVVLEAFGAPHALAALEAALAGNVPPHARIDRNRREALTGTGPAGFSIAPSTTGERPRPSIPADLALCSACRREVDDPQDRRFGYPFTHCTECGPRYSIVTALPYDRARTSLATFELCADCAREYATPADRRFHAEAIACAACGPRVWLESGLAALTVHDEPLAEAARRLVAGEIVAIQGLGGFHLACDATRVESVARLRERKQRDQKPFAVLTLDVERAGELGELDAAARAVLTSPAHPIVLVRARSSPVAANVAPESTRIGLLLPYTPLHHLLAKRVARPLVFTSGNRSGEPIAITHDEARRTLGAVADVFLLHDRPIVRRVEDSVVMTGARGTRVLRRARGFAPRSIRLPRATPEPVLAVGGHLKNTVCLAVGDEAFLSPHLGDLASYEAERAFEQEIEGFERLLGVRPRVVAHDLHPDYASTRYALSRAEKTTHAASHADTAAHTVSHAVTTLGVQHHHAHVLAALAEHAVTEPVVAAVFDGTGFGLDGTAWGGEWLCVDGLTWSRPFALRPIAVAGGERGIRAAWRAAWALLRDVFGPEAEALAGRLPLFAKVEARERQQVTRMLTENVNVVPMRGVGRYFDAFAALGLARPHAGFEAELAVLWEEAAGDLVLAPYPYTAPRAPAANSALGPENELDLRPTVRAAVADLIDGVAPGAVSARFHATLVEATVALLARLRRGNEPIVLSGGCFYNQRLYAGLARELPQLLPPGEVPMNDGGLALGQAWAGVLALGAKRN